MAFKSYEETKVERIENGIKITRYNPSDKNGYRKVRENYYISRNTMKNPAVVIERIGDY